MCVWWSGIYLIFLSISSEILKRFKNKSFFFQYPFTGVLLAQYQTKEIQKIIRWVAKTFGFFLSRILPKHHLKAISDFVYLSDFTVYKPNKTELKQDNFRHTLQKFLNLSLATTELPNSLALQLNRDDYMINVKHFKANEKKPVILSRKGTGSYLWS